MATAQVDWQRLTLLAGMLIASALTIVALRAIQSSKLVEALPLPVADLQALSPYLNPLRDASLVAQGTAASMVIARDPFAPAGVAPSARQLQATPDLGSQKATGGGRWVVSSILVEGSRKSAIVNDVWVTIGDTLGGGSRLTSVERDHVVVTDAKGVRHKVPIQGGESW